MAGDFGGIDINGYYHPEINQANKNGLMPVKDKSQLDMTDFLTLMVTEMTSQSIDSTMDTSDMLNQLVQMQMVQAMTSMTDASVMSYAASLVGKEVTIGIVGKDGNLEEHVGQVIGTGTMDGKQVVFLNDEKYYYLSQIMAVGRLPAKPEKPEEGGKPENGETKPDGVKPGEGETKPEGGETTKPDGVKPGEGGAKPDSGETKPDGGQTA